MKPPNSIDDTEEKRRLKMLDGYIYTGLLSYLITGTSILIYCLLTWSTGKNRIIIVSIVFAALWLVPTIYRYRPVIVTSRYRELYFISWNISCYFFSCCILVLDGGINSPFVLVWFLPTIYLLFGFSRRSILLCCTIGLLMYTTGALLTNLLTHWQLFVLQFIMLLGAMAMVFYGTVCRDRYESELQTLHSKLHHLASTDSLTGCLNQRAFNTCLAEQIELAKRLQHPLTLLAIDIDYFKKINDQYGHLAGDDALQKLGELLRKTLRKTDISGRLGGDELAVICPDTDKDKAIEVTRRLQKALDDLDSNFEMTLSIGIYCAPALHLNNHQVETFRSRADQALYQAKAQGRNCFVNYTPDAV